MAGRPSEFGGLGCSLSRGDPPSLTYVLEPTLFNQSLARAAARPALARWSRCDPHPCQDRAPPSPAPVFFDI